jgi:hypothetical protein
MTVKIPVRLGRSTSKYRNVRVKLDGHTFDSKREAVRYGELKILQDSGRIAGLKIHPHFPIAVDGQAVCCYVADFAYDDLEKDCYTVEDVKGVKTAVYLLKKKLVKAKYGMQIQEV